jgi:outer membrane immunogenic protein
LKHLTLLIATAAIVAPLNFATAADIDIAPYDWSGFYSGVHLGQIWADGDYLYDDSPLDRPFDFKSSKLSFGTLGGYNFQSGDNWVFGVENDSTFTNLKDTFVAPATVASFRVKMEGSLRARVGFAHDRFLPFLTAGVGIAEGKTSDNLAGSDKNYHLGLVAGAGLEYALTDQFRIRGEYLYKNFGKETYHMNDPFLGPVADIVEWDEHVARAAFIYAW